MIFFDLVSSVGVARPVKVDITCLLKPPSMMVSGLPPLFQMLCSTALRFASVKARCVPSVRVPVPSAAEGSARPAHQVSNERFVLRASNGCNIVMLPPGGRRYHLMTSEFRIVFEGVSAAERSRLASKLQDSLAEIGGVQTSILRERPD